MTTHREAADPHPGQLPSGTYTLPNYSGEPAIGRLDAVAAFLADVARAAAPGALFASIANGIVERLGATTAEVYRAADDEGRTLGLAASRNLDIARQEQVLVIKIDDRLPAACAARTRALHLVDASARSHEAGAGAEPGREVVLAFPIAAGDRLLAAVSATFAVAPSPEHCATVASLSHVLGAMVERIMLRGAAEECRVLSGEIAVLEECARRHFEWTSLLAEAIRRPLQMIVVQAATLSRARLDGSVASSVEHLVESAHTLNRLVTDLVDIGRVESGWLRLNVERTDLVELTRGVVASRARAKRMRVEASGELPRVDVDRRRLRDVLGRLLVNAERRSRPSAFIRIEIECRGAHVSLSIAFEPDAALEKTTVPCGDDPREAEPDEDRTDLAMRYCRALLDAHGAMLWTNRDGETIRIGFSIPIPR